MEILRVLMDFSNVHKVERSAEFSHKTKRLMPCVSVNPWNEDVLFSLFLDRELVIENRVCIVGEKLLNSFGLYDYSSKINGDFMFVPDSPNYKIGDKVKYEDLGSKVFLYFVDRGE